MASSFLADAEPDDAARRLFEDDVRELGFVMNASRMWAYQPRTMSGLFDLMGEATEAGGLSFRQRAILVTACASMLGDSYCSLAWGGKLAARADTQTAVGVVSGDDTDLTGPERALAAWARKVTVDPNATTATDVDALRGAGFDDGQIFAVTVFVALRVAFSTVNDALGARPDRALVDALPARLVDAVTFGRPVTDQPT